MWAAIAFYGILTVAGNVQHFDGPRAILGSGYKSEAACQAEAIRIGGINWRREHRPVTIMCEKQEALTS